MIIKNHGCFVLLAEASKILTEPKTWSEKLHWLLQLLKQQHVDLQGLSENSCVLHLLIFARGLGFTSEILQNTVALFLMLLLEVTWVCKKS